MCNSTYLNLSILGLGLPRGITDISTTGSRDSNFYVISQLFIGHLNLHFLINFRKKEVIIETDKVHSIL